MDYVYSLITQLVGDPSKGGWLFVLFAAGAIFMVSFAFFLLLLGIFDPMRSRLNKVAGGRSRTQVTGDRIAAKVKQASPALLPKGGDESSTRTRLTLAGYRSPGAVQLYYGVRLLTFVGFPLGAILVLSMAGASANVVILVAVLVTSIGYIAPSFYLDRKIKKRQREIGNSFPDVLDMLVVCCEAGLGLDAALQRVGKELSVSHSILADELTLVNAEIRAGAKRQQAYKNLAKRTGLAEIRGLVATLTQSMHFGSNVADVLRIYSEDFRDKRAQAAEEQAAMLAVKMIFPLVFCFMPAFFIITMGPAIIALKTVLGAIGK